MKEQIMQEVGELIKLGKEGVMKAVVILQEQCPLLVSEIYKWEVSKSLIIGVIALSIGIFFTYSAKKFGKDEWTTEDNDGDSLCLFFSIALGFIGLGVAIGYFMTCIKIYVAPRLFLISYIGDMVK